MVVSTLVVAVRNQ